MTKKKAGTAPELPQEVPQEAPQSPRITAQHIINVQRHQEMVIMANKARRHQEDQADDIRLAEIAVIIATAEKLSETE